MLKHEVCAHDLNAARGLYGHDEVGHAHGALVVNAKHAGDGGAGDVCVQDSHLSSAARELACKDAGYE